MDQGEMTMKSNKERTADMEDRAHELCVFLGGDAVALKISRALRCHGDITSVEGLRDEYGRSAPRPGYYLEDIRLIGPQAIQRIKEKIEGPPVPFMDVTTASLIIRMELALCDEGIGPEALFLEDEAVSTAQGDRAVLKQAVRVAGHLFREYQLRDAGLLQ